MIGIYKWENLINGKIYIGQSVNIAKRERDHTLRAFNDYPTNREYDKALYRAMRKYGLNNFSFKIIEECSEKKLNDREIYWITFYDSYHNGYNETQGGDTQFPPCKGEQHPRHKLTEQQVYDIRERYKNHEFKDDVYELYKNLIGSSGFHKIWNGETWPNVHFDVYTQENREFHTLIRNSHPGKGNGKRVSIEDIKKIRKRKQNGETLEEIYKDYIDKVGSKQILRHIYDNKTYTFITI